MSLNVKSFDVELAKKELKKCPKIVQDYVLQIEENREHWKQMTYNCIKKLK